MSSGANSLYAKQDYSIEPSQQICSSLQDPSVECEQLKGFQSGIRNQVHLTCKIWLLLPCFCPLFVHKAQHHSNILHRWCHYVSRFVEFCPHFVASTFGGLFFGTHRSWQRPWHPAKHRTMPKPRHVTQVAQVAQVASFFVTQTSS